MDDKMKLAQAEQVYTTLCQMLDSQQWHYTQKEDKLQVNTWVKGEHQSIDIIMRVHVEKSLFMVISPLAFTVPQERKQEMAVAVWIVNSCLASGSFDYDMKKGRLYFRMASSFLDCRISEQTLEYLLYNSYTTIDKHSENFKMLADGTMSLVTFMEALEKEGGDSDDR